MDQALADLIAISRRVGVDTSLVQGGGGNTSVKTADGKYMYIKASGTAIKDISQDRGWRRLRVASVCAIVQDESLAGLDDTNRENEIANRLRLCCDDEVAGRTSRPSVEAHLHASLARCVVHLHPVAVGAYVCAKNGRAALEKLFASEKLPPLWVPDADPGYMLAVTVCRLVSDYKRKHGKAPWALFLEKHGLFVTADSAEEVLRRVRKVIAVCIAGLPKAKSGKEKQAKREEVAAAGLAIRRAIWEATGAYQCVRRFSDENVAAFVARPDAKQLAAAPSMTPDEMVYANGSPLWVERPDPAAIRAKLARLLAKGEKPAASFLLKSLGLFVSGNAGALESIKDVVTAALQVRGYTASFGGVNALTKRQRDFILNWESESFRKKIAGLSGAGELVGRIAVVTGAGSGLGRSIAVGLAGAGAVVALADIDVKAAEETAAIIAKQSPSAATLAAKCNVTSEAEVARAFRSPPGSLGRIGRAGERGRHRAALRPG